MIVSEAVVISGGKSSRMGRDKALLEFGGYPTMAEYQYRKLERLFDNVYISAKDNKFNFHSSLILDRYEASSPMVALASIGEQIPDRAIFVLSVDTPMVDEATIKKMCKSYSNSKADILIASSPRGLEPLCAIYSPSALQQAKKLLNMDIHRLHSLLEVSQIEECYFEEESLFDNLNRPEEYRRAIEKC